MGRGPLIADEERGCMKGLHESGRSVRGIAQHLKRFPNGVSYTLKSSGKKGGRPPTLSDRQVRQVVRVAATGNFSATELKAEYKLECSVRTVQRLLSRTDFLSYSKMDRTLPLTKEHKAARLEFAERLSTAALKEVVWTLIIFSDEKKFNLDGPDGFKNYWRDLRSLPRRCMRRQNGGGSLIVWEAFGVKGKSELVVLKGRQNSLSYIYTISEHLLPFAHRNYGTDFVFMQDNASIHASDETKSDTRLTARSPDLNPIENVWSILARKVYSHGKQYSSVPELTAAVLSAWESVMMKELLDLMESIPARCFKVGNKNGDAIPY
ncbi:Transposase [Phytophthora megakarya]|uniref:Transposase n=1 Tax=Phytophthora megakarya TaxID=4795 RepID=A0A225WT93_9STRA|nr:Transposase [Phytophthora megakarya]